jgi:hypothetical protein
MSGVLESRVVPLPVERAQAPAVAVSSVRAVLAGYQLVYDRLEAGGRMAWARPGRWMRWPAPRALTRILLTYRVRARIDVLRRRSRAQAALMKDAGAAEANLKSLDLFAESLPPTPSARLLALGAAIGGVLAAFVLAKLVAGNAHQAQLLGDLSEAALTLDRNAAVDAVRQDRLQAAHLLGASMLLIWSFVLIALPLVPASVAARRLVREQPGLLQAEERAFADLRAPQPAEFNLAAVVDWLLVIPVLVFGIYLIGIGVAAIRADPGEAVTAGVMALALFTVAAGVIRSMRHRDEQASVRAWPQKLARRLMFGSYVIALILATAL